ncbi:MAG TPA: FAD:protein FMN transferase, partial [Kofleriaceae bacterium]|nr:FAD:protein FMN transferase [Kofleriaceae bacterium]
MPSRSSHVLSRVGLPTVLVGVCAAMLAPVGPARAEQPTTAAAPAPAGKPTKIQYADTAMGPTVTVWLWTADERGAAQAAEAVFNEMKRLDKEMTTWDPASEVSQINAAAGDKPVKVSAET